MMRPRSTFAAEGLPEETETLVLGHLSETNNSPWHVRLAAEQALESAARSRAW